MQQFLADQVDQMDLALDQLAMKDRNFDRFACMLIDNVVELTLHQHARAKDYENRLWRTIDKPKYDPQLVTPALGQRFDAKLRLARATQMIPAETADSIHHLHAFRNVVYHAGMRHEGILHPIAIFYFLNACTVLKGFSPNYWSSSSRDQISHRAIKYLGGTVKIFKQKEAFLAAYSRLEQVAQSLGDTLVVSLHSDLSETIQRTNKQLDFLADDSPKPTTRREAVIQAQAWPFAFTTEGEEWARANGCSATGVHDYVAWLSKAYPWPAKSDPIPGWKKRLAQLKVEQDPHKALRKYSDFMKQTEEIRGHIDEAAANLDGYIQNQIDIARGN
jgi:hypothetical protein